MTWSDLPLRPSPRALRQFAGAWLVFFLAFGAHQYLVRQHLRLGMILMALAVIVGVLGLVKPSAVRWLFVGWMIAAFPVGWMVSLAMLLIMFYGLITPIACLFRLCGRDLLGRHPAPETTSFWFPKQMPQDVRSYFRQY